MDLEGKPMYQDTVSNRCPVCLEWTQKQSKLKKQGCYSCWKEIPPYENVSAGYSSRVIDHWHDRKVSGVSGAHVITKTLCRECYNEEFKKLYPKKELPV